LQNYIKAFDNNQETGQPITEITIKKAIKYVAKAWDLVQPEVIINCWRKTNILPPNTDDDESIGGDDFIDFTDFDEYEEINKIQDFIDRLTPNIYENPIPAEEYLKSEKEETIHQMITDEEIIKLMKEPEEEPNNEESEIPIISNYEALVALNQIIIYAEQKSNKINFPKDQIQAIKKLRKAVEREEFQSKQQVTLDSYLENVNKDNTNK